MFANALLIAAFAGVAELLGLGGVPARSLAFESVFFIILLLALGVTALKNSIRR